MLIYMLFPPGLECPLMIIQGNRGEAEDVVPGQKERSPWNLNFLLIQAAEEGFRDIGPKINLHLVIEKGEWK